MLCFYPPTSPPDRGIRHSTTQVILKMHTFKKCPPRWISPLQCALTKNAPASPLQSALTKSQDLNSPGMNTYKKHPGGGGSPLAIRHFQLSTVSSRFTMSAELQLELDTSPSRSLTEPGADAINFLLLSSARRSPQRRGAPSEGRAEFFGRAASFPQVSDGATPPTRRVVLAGCPDGRHPFSFLPFHAGEFFPPARAGARRTQRPH